MPSTQLLPAKSRDHVNFDDEPSWWRDPRIDLSLVFRSLRDLRALCVMLFSLGSRLAGKIDDTYSTC